MEKHECLSYVDGDEIIYRCALCPEYERRENLETGKHWVSGMSVAISHYGTYAPEGSDFKIQPGKIVVK